MTIEHKANGRISGLEPVAVIDIGSNSVRLVVYEGAKRSPPPLFNEKVLCGLGRALATTGELDEIAAGRALRALRRFRAIATQLGARRTHVIATAAAREASNGPDFIARAQEILGTSIQVLSGKKEAQLAAAGVIAGFHKVNGLAADLGGGSLEIIDIKKREMVGGVTLPLGGLRLIDWSKGSLKKAGKIIDAELDKVDWLGRGKGRAFYAVGGTWRAFSRLHMNQTDYPLSVMHGYRIPTSEALTFARLLDKQSAASLEGIGALSRARRETLPFGALILEGLLKRIQPSEVLISAFGVREGLLYSTLDRTEQERDPLLAACEELAALRSRSAEHAHELVAWTDTLFRKPGPEEDDEERRLRAAACLLSDIGWRAHPDYRGSQSLNIIAHADFAGIDHPGRAFLALTVYYRHQGPVDETPGQRLQGLAGLRGVERARILGAAIRAAHMLSAGMPGVIPNTPVAYEEDKLVLTLPETLTVLDGERLERRLGALARMLGRKGEIRLAAARRREPATV